MVHLEASEEDRKEMIRLGIRRCRELDIAAAVRAWDTLRAGLIAARLKHLAVMLRDYQAQGRLHTLGYHKALIAQRQENQNAVTNEMERRRTAHIEEMARRRKAREDADIEWGARMAKAQLLQANARA